MNFFAGFIIGVITGVAVVVFLSWLASRSENPVTESAIPASPVPPIVETPPEPSKPVTNWVMKLAATGQETFTPEPLNAGRVYQLTFAGTYSYSAGFLERRQADAVFYMDEKRNFKVRYTGVEVAGRRAGKGELDSWTEDRANHVYSCLIEGSGERMPLRLAAPNDTYCLDELDVQINLQPEGTPSVGARERQRAQEKAAADLAKQQQEEEEEKRIEQARKQAEEEERKRREQETAAKQQGKRAQQIAELSLKVRTEANFLDRAFREEFVKKHQYQLETRLKTEWTNEYRQLMTQPELVAALGQQAPEVLEWHEQRLQMVLAAERLAVLPLKQPLPEQPATNVDLDVPITYRTLDKVEGLVTELFELRDDYDRYKQAQVRSGNPGQHQEKMQEILRAMDRSYEVLRRYGINSETPEGAEEQFRTIWPLEQVKTPYEEIEDKINAGEPVGVDIIARRLKDLFAEDCILVVHRKRALHRLNMQRKQEIDGYISQARQECARWLDFLRAQGHDIELGPDKEETLEQGVLGLVQQQKRLEEALTRIGQTETVEQMRAHFAEAIAYVFKPEDRNYT